MVIYNEYICGGLGVMHFCTKDMQIVKGENFRLYGRPYYIDNVPALSWSNSGIEFCAEFERFTVYFGDYVSEMPAYVKIYVDGKEFKHAVSGKNSAAVLEGFKNAPHTVKILRISEGDVLLTVKFIRIFGIRAEFLEPPRKSRGLKLEFLGDSITCGFGVTASSEQNVFLTSEEDSTQTYAFLTAKALGAEIRTVSISGQGIVHSCGDSVGIRMEEILKLKARGRSDVYTPEKDWQPDFFILNAGTNDKCEHTDGDTFFRYSEKLLSDIREMYPKAHIIWLYGMMSKNFLKQVDAVAGSFAHSDGNFSYLFADSVWDNRQKLCGAIGHPNTLASEKVSKQLIKLIEKKLSQK